MQKRKPGNSNLEVSALGLGCMSMTGALYGSPANRRQMIALIRAAFEQGLSDQNLRAGLTRPASRCQRGATQTVSPWIRRGPVTAMLHQLVPFASMKL
jgi:hypothetical protein